MSDGPSLFEELQAALEAADLNDVLHTSTSGNANAAPHAAPAGAAPEQFVFLEYSALNQVLQGLEECPAPVEQMPLRMSEAEDDKQAQDRDRSEPPPMSDAVAVMHLSASQFLGMLWRAFNSPTQCYWRPHAVSIVAAVDNLAIADEDADEATPASSRREREQIRKQHAAERRSAELTCRLSLAFHGVTLALLALGAIVGLLKAEGPWFSTVPSTMLAFWLSVSALIIVCLSATTIQHRYIAALNATHAVLEELAQSIERYDDAFQRGVRFLQELEMVARGYHLSQNPSSHILRIEHGGRVFQAQPLRRLLVNSLNSQLSRLAVTSAVIRNPSALVTASEAFRPSAITFQPPLQHVDAASASQAGSGGGSSQSTVATLKELLHTHSTTCALRRQFVIGMRDLVALQCGITTSDAVEDETETAAAHPPSRAQSKSKSVRARFAACCQPKRWLKWISEFAGHGSDAVAFVSRGCVSQAIERSAVTIAVLRSALPSVSHATASDARSIDTLLRYPIAFRTRDHAGNVPSAAKTSARGSTRNPKRKSDKRSTESKDDEESSVPFAADPRDAELAELDDLRSAVIRLYFRLRSGLARLVLCQQRNYSPALRLLLASAVEQSRASQSESDATARAHIATPAPGTGSASSTSVEQDESKVEADANAAIQQLFDNRMREMKTELFGQLHRDSSYVRAAISESISLWKHFHGVISRLSQMADCPLPDDENDAGFLSAAFAKMGRRAPIDEFGVDDGVLDPEAVRSALSKELLNALAKNAGSEQAGSKTEGVFQGIGTVPDEDDFTNRNVDDEQVSDFRDSLALLAELKTVLQHRRKPGDPEPSADDEDYDRPMEPDLPRRRYED